MSLSEKLFNCLRTRSTAPRLLLGFFNGFQHKPVHPEDLITDQHNGALSLGLRRSPLDEEPARVCVCLLKLTPELLNQGSAVLRFCLSSLNKYTRRRVFLNVRDALSEES